MAAREHSLLLMGTDDRAVNYYACIQNYYFWWIRLYPTEFPGLESKAKILMVLKALEKNKCVGEHAGWLG